MPPISAGDYSIGCPSISSLKSGAPFDIGRILSSSPTMFLCVLELRGGRIGRAYTYESLISANQKSAGPVTSSTAVTKTVTGTIDLFGGQISEGVGSQVMTGGSRSIKTSTGSIFVSGASKLPIERILARTTPVRLI